MPTKLPPIPSPPGTAFREFRINVLPILAFAGVLTAAVQTWRGYVGPSSIVGEAEAVRTVVSSHQAGRVVQLLVGPLQKVSAGEPLVQILTSDPRVLEAQLALSKARIDYVRLSVEPKLRKENNRINYQKLRLDWMVQRADLGMARARLIYYETEFERVRRIFSPAPGGTASVTTPGANPTAASRDRIISLAEYDLAVSNVNATRAQVEEIARLVSDMEIAMKEFEPEEAKIEEDEPNSIRAAVAVEERQLGLVEAQLAPIMLNAPIDGVVSIVHRRTGESVVPGDPILTISQMSPERVVAYIRQPLNVQVRTNQSVEIRARSLDHATGIGKVYAIGTQLEPITSQLLPARAQGGSGELGLPVLVTIPAGMRLFGGEVVDLRLVD